jgi:predicted negative regulator of RcsB-dependent stress response
MKLDTIITKLLPAKDFIVRYSVIIFVLSVVAIFGYMTLNIAHFANLDPSSAQLQEKTDSLTAVKLDQTSITKIKQLQDQNINIESLFDNGRANPFQ